MNGSKTALEPGALSVPDFAAWAGISEPWAWKQIYSGQVRSVKRGRRRLVPMEAARAWLAGEQDAA
ncbi:MAG: helix-turn-helix domain-containing protein [Erythrobacter sp.]